MTLSELADELNQGAFGRPIGELQYLRSKRTGKRLLTRNLFDSRTIFEHYAFHVGGRTEIQYNFGYDSDQFRYGLAFSLEPSQNLPDFNVLAPNIGRFNEFLRIYPDEYADLSMWHSTDDGRSPEYPPAPIPSDLVRSGNFIFLGILEPEENIAASRILDLFDRLLPLYQFVQGDCTFPTLTPANGGFTFTPGCTLKSSGTTATSTERTINIKLRHNDLQFALFQILTKLHGHKSVGAEQGNGAGARVDIIVRSNGGFWFYEIKTATSARGCIREGLAQLIEYSLWPGAQKAERLIIIGEPAIDADSQSFLDCLKRDFNLPIEYQQIDMAAGKLI